MKNKPMMKLLATKMTREATSTSLYTGLSANQDANTTEEQSEL
jgi:ferritin